MLNFTGSSHAWRMWCRMMMYIYVPNLVQISLTVPEILGCIDTSFRSCQSVHWEMLDHPRRLVTHMGSPNFMEIGFAALKLRIATSSFGRFGLKMLIHAPHFGLGADPLNGLQYQRYPNRHLFVQKHDI